MSLHEKGRSPWDRQGLHLALCFQDWGGTQPGCSGLLGQGLISSGGSEGGLGDEGRTVSLSTSLMAFVWLSTQLLVLAFAPMVHLMWECPHTLPMVSGDGGHEAVQTKQPCLILPSPNASL